MKRNSFARSVRCALMACAVGVVLAAPAAAQLGGLGRPATGGLVGVLQAPAQVLPPVARITDPQTLLTLREARLEDLVRAHPKALERDDHGYPVVRGEVLAVAPGEAALALARKAGFEIVRAPKASDGDAAIAVLRAPPARSARQAVRELRRLDPEGTYDFNSLYLPTGEASPPAASQDPPRQTPSAPSAAARIGLVDTAIDANHPVFVGIRLEQQGFSRGGSKPAAHGTEVASLLVGRAGAFQGAAPGAALAVADIFGDDPAGGAADALARALAWLGRERVQVVNISLVGPPNAALGAEVAALARRGILIVAAVGNDGPAAPPAYPASYPEVLAVTGVDSRGHVLLEAGRASHLDFAAPGADMAAAGLKGGYVVARGTSFAAPLVAGELASLMATPRSSGEAAVTRLSDAAVKGGGYGRGLVAVSLRTPPAAVHARLAAQ